MIANQRGRENSSRAPFMWRPGWRKVLEDPLAIPGVSAAHANGVRRSFAAKSSAIPSSWGAKHLPTPCLSVL